MKITSISSDKVRVQAQVLFPVTIDIDLDIPPNTKEYNLQQFIIKHVKRNAAQRLESSPLLRSTFHCVVKSSEE